MLRLSFLAVLILPFSALATVEDDSVFQPILKAVEPIISEYYPEYILDESATIIPSQPMVVLKADTMEFTLHRILRDGVVLEKTYQREGPNAKGFLLDIEYRGKRPYAGPLTVPQILNRPYWNIWVHNPQVDADYFFIRLNYGSRVNKEFVGRLQKVLYGKVIPFGQTDTGGEIATLSPYDRVRLDPLDPTKMYPIDSKDEDPND